jgi:membrane protein insertase Oxa1/YidC/SpoIIIJ
MITESGAASELDIIGAVSRGDIKSPEILKALGSINFNFFGIDLTEKPTFAFDIINKFRLSWIMPILAFVSQMFTSWISQRIQKKQNPDAPSMGFMMIGMSIFSLVIGFSLPGGVTFYWTCSSLIGGAIQAFTQIFYGPQKMLGKERVKELSKQCDFEEIQLKKLSENKE